jgi:hypothetical protein
MPSQKQILTNKLGVPRRRCSAVVTRADTHHRQDELVLCEHSSNIRMPMLSCSLRNLPTVYFRSLC